MFILESVVFFVFIAQNKATLVLQRDLDRLTFKAPMT